MDHNHLQKPLPIPTATPNVVYQEIFDHNPVQALRQWQQERQRQQQQPLLLQHEASLELSLGFRRSERFRIFYIIKITGFFVITNYVRNTCGLPGHRRTTHRDCLANPNRIATREQNQNEERDYDDSRVAVPVPVCASCGQEGHSCSTHNSCPNNHSNISNGISNGNANEEPNLEATPSVRVCASCGQEGHLRNTHRSCPNYCSHPNNIQQQNEGAVELPPLNPTPPAISQLLRGTDTDSQQFRAYIHSFNSALGFTSLGVNADQNVANFHGRAYNFRIHGSVYHRIGSLLTADNRPAFAQIYVHYPATEAANRQAVSNVQHNNNTLQISENTPDRRSYNAPTAEEVGIIIIGNHGENVGHRDIVLRTRPNRLERISEMHQLYDSLQYLPIFLEVG
ncbi:hypothetical protein BDA99DRAFT_566157 [Phascolomyces articulosus]|uniref:CCHC-type domain-containing protein n=1 Tax=Phascolomyces articulosus TaxID=60185 RepID=A0AAD5JZV1_9FUNG|nr:hypothetical protein BDA99DRAFT_566157 [Phascolomyces articulosus]